MYDFAIIGSGLYGATFSYLASYYGYKVLLIERRSHIGGNCFTQNISNIHVHIYGAHIFHTSNTFIWNFVNSITPFQPFINSPIAISNGKAFNLPFNMNTFAQMWGITDPREAKKIIDKQKLYLKRPAKNLEEQALSLVGQDIYDALIKNYTKKQWGKNPEDLPPWIIQRLPLRFTYNNNYFTDTYQGIPINGYTELLEKLLSGAEINTKTDYFC